MKLVVTPISKKELSEIAKKIFGNLIKAVVDVEKELLVIDAELHADEEQFLLTKGSKQNDLWGINLYPEESMKDFIEFDSMINVRPRQNNFSRNVESTKIRNNIIRIVKSLVKE